MTVPLCWNLALKAFLGQGFGTRMLISLNKQAKSAPEIRLTFALSKKSTQVKIYLAIKWLFLVEPIKSHDQTFL